MPSTRTENRERKLKFILGWIDVSVQLALLTHNEREGLNMKHFKEIDKKLKNLLFDASFDKKRVEKFLQSL